MFASVGTGREVCVSDAVHGRGDWLCGEVGTPWVSVAFHVDPGEGGYPREWVYRVNYIVDGVQVSPEGGAGTLEMQCTDTTTNVVLSDG